MFFYGNKKRGEFPPFFYSREMLAGFPKMNELLETIHPENPPPGGTVPGG